LFLRDQFHAIVADIARRYRSRHVDCYLPSSSFRGDSAGRDLATLDTGDGRRRYNSSLVKERDWYRRIVRRYGETYEPNPSRQCEPISSTMCWIGLARKVSQNQSEPFSFLRRMCAGERGYHTRGVSRACWASLSKREPSVQHVEGSLRAPRRAAAPRFPTPSERESHKDFAVIPRYTVSGEHSHSLSASPIDPRFATKVRSTGRRWEPVNQFLLLYAVVGWAGCRPLKEGGQRNL
jgi:hypothetical protein